MIFHIATAAEWKKSFEIGEYSFDALKTEGFIHCSERHQVLAVAKRIFKGRTDLVLLKIENSQVVPKIVFENTEGGTEKFPHIYGPLNVDAIVEVFLFHPVHSGEFELPADV